MIITNKIDLTTCNKGDLLIGRNGAIMEYIGINPMYVEIKEEIIKHLVRYVKIKDGSKYVVDSQGTYTDDGQVRLKQKLETDEDIVCIIRGNKRKVKIEGV